MMRRFGRIISWVTALATLLTVASCTNDLEEGVGSNSGYGYAQFKLYKEASYEPAASRGVVDGKLEYLTDAYKVQVTLGYGQDYAEHSLTQTLTLDNDGSEKGEYGLRSDKLKLIVGSYKLISYTLFDANDNELRSFSPTIDSEFEVIDGGLTVQDIAVNVIARGKVRFTLVKDLSGFTNNVSRVTTDKPNEYTLDEIGKANVTLVNELSKESITIRNLECEYDDFYTEEGKKSSQVKCDSIIWLPEADYTISKYETFTKKGILLESTSGNEQDIVSVRDNKLIDAKVKVVLNESDEYIKDYYALRAIWLSLNGPNWNYNGEDYSRGTNWNFDKDVDLWGEQPGVMIHSNGRIARIDISNFGFEGHLPKEIGQLTELVELYLGTHNDTNTSYDPTLDNTMSVAERSQNRMELHSQWLRTQHIPIQFSEPIARALMEHNIDIPEIQLHKTMSEEEIFDAQGKPRSIKPKDTLHGTIINGLKSIPAEIGNLKKLQYFYVANSTLTSLPKEMAELESCTDFEIYNCPNMKEFPLVVGDMPELISVNLSNNSQWSAEECYRGLEAIANGPSREKIQILYARENNLKEIPENFKQMKKIGLLDLAYNQIEKVHPWGREVAPIQLYLDHNNITELPTDESGYFCGYDDVESFSVNFNKLTKVPNIFNAKSIYTMGTVSFGGNEITGFEGEEDGTYRGVKTNTLVLSMNPLKEYPACLAKTNSTIGYINLSHCNMESIPGEALESENMIYLTSMDLTYNRLTDLPDELHAGNIPYLYGVDLSYNAFSKFPYEPLDCASLTVYALRGQRDDNGNRCLREWPTGIYQHFGLRALYIGSNDLRVIDDTISTLCYYLDISDNPNIVFDAKDICYAWQVGAYILYYDKTQNILNCPIMLE